MLLALTILMLVVAQGPDDAKDAVNRMEAQIQKSKTFQVDIDIVIEPGKASSFKGKLMVAKGNKVRMNLDGAIKDKLVKIAIVSDGAQMSVAGFGSDTSVNATPKDLSEKVLASVSRSGIFKSYFAIGGEYTASDFKLGKNETMGGKEAQAVEYKQTSKPGKGKFDKGETILVTVWIDVKTNLPLKRLITFKEHQDSFTITETYTNAVLDAVIAADKFALPK